MAVLADTLDIPRASIIPFDEWLNRVCEHSGSVETDNPAKKILEFFDVCFLRMACGGLIWVMTWSREHSETLASGGPVSADMARKYVQAWKEMGFLHNE